MISFTGKKITEQDVLSVFGLVARGALEGLADAILKGDIPAVLDAVAALDAAGKDMQRLVLELIEHFRNLLVCACAGDKARDLDVAESQVEVLRQQAGIINPDVLALVRAKAKAARVAADETLSEKLDALARQIEAAGNFHAVF